MTEQRTALITGASRKGAIGLEVCRQLAVLGFTVIQGTRDLEKGRAAAAALASEGIILLTRQLDVTDPQSIEQLRTEVEVQFGKLDVLVNNAAGYTDWSEMPATADMGNAHAVLETTLFGAWRMYQAFLPLLRRSARGRVVNVSSGAGSHGDPQFGLVATGGSAPSYGISKAALNALTVKLAAEVGMGMDTSDQLRGLFLRYLAAFGPASVRDFQTWVGIAKLTEPIGAVRSELVQYRAEDGRELFDLPDAPVLPEDTPAPIRFVPEYDNLVIGHDDRTRVLPEAFRTRVFLSAGRVRATILVDGFVRGVWRVERVKRSATLVIEPFARLTADEQAALMDEGLRLLRFIEDNAESLDVRVET